MRAPRTVHAEAQHAFENYESLRSLSMQMSQMSAQASCQSACRPGLRCFPLWTSQKMLRNLVCKKLFFSNRADVRPCCIRLYSTWVFTAASFECGTEVCKPAGARFGPIMAQ